MYFVPFALLVEGDLETGAELGWGAFFLDNLLPGTIGNVIGGALLVGAVYWFVYLRERPERGGAPVDPAPRPRR